MRYTLLTLLIFCFASANAQNYNCLQPGPLQFFTNGNGYLRAMRIDSVRTVGSDTVYYPYHTPRGGYGCTYSPVLAPGGFDSTGGSWLGKNVIKRANGDFLFDNLWQDTVLIKTRAHVGDSWPFFNDTSRISYKATVTDAFVMSVLGSPDSVKQITIEADSAGAVLSVDPVNGFQILLSKNHGFVDGIDLYTFPYHRPNELYRYLDFFDYYFDLVLGNLGTADITCFKDFCTRPDTVNSIFHQIQFHNPQTREIFDFSVGDVYETKDFHDEGGMGYYEEVRLDSVVTKTVLPYSVSYKMVERRKITHLTVSGWTTTTTVAYARDTISAWGDTSRLLPLYRLPEEWLSGQFYHYVPSSGIGTCTAATYTINLDNVNYEGRNILFEETDFNMEVGYSNYSYSLGYGNSSKYSHNYSYNTGETSNYIYVKKSGVECGTFMGVSEGIPQSQLLAEDILLYPNPASNTVYLSAPVELADVSVYNLLGQRLINVQPNKKQVEIGIASLPAGIYIVRINNTEAKRFVKE